MRMNVDKNIAAIRCFALRKGWRKAELALKAGLHQNTLRDFDNPEWSPNVRTLRALEAIMPAGKSSRRGVSK